jgi:hypothetical protein
VNERRPRKVSHPKRRGPNPIEKVSTRVFVSRQARKCPLVHEDQEPDAEDRERDRQRAVVGGGQGGEDGDV